MPSSSSPLSPQSVVVPGVERMLVRGGSRSTGTRSLREIDEEEEEDDDDGGGKTYVAVGKDLKDSKANIRWAAAARKLHANKLLVLLHVHQPADRIMSGLCKVPAKQLEEKELRAYRKIEKDDMNKLLEQYLCYCRAFPKVQAEILVIEKNNVANGIVELIDQHHITKLVMGTSSFSVKRQVPKSKVAAIVHQQAKPYCQILYICKEGLACTRDASQLADKGDSPRSSSGSSLSDQSEFPPRSVSMPSWYPGFLGSPDQQSLRQRSNSVSYPFSRHLENGVENISPIRRHSVDVAPKGCSPNSSHQSNGVSSPTLTDLDTVDGSSVPVSSSSSEEHQHSMVEANIQNEMFEQWQQVRDELERSRKEASEGRQKAERELFEASKMFRARENSLCKEKIAIEERLTREKASLEKEHLQIYNELQKANEQIMELERRLMDANSLMQELHTVQGELQREKDNAVKEAEKMSQINCNNVSCSTGAVALTEFTYTEIKEATNDFNESKMIGHGGCGSVYKGFLRHTTVAIKKFNREGTTGEKEFDDEVEILGRMGHPNLVTLIGVCREAKALVYEFLPNGSLEDRLQCKHQTDPLPWRMRIKIAADICTALIFLHSNKPKGIVHGDLKPDNVLLGDNFVGKLGDFGISRPLNLTNTTITPYHRTNQIKGTLGYMDPGYIASGEITAQYDVYSFGVVLLRLLTGKSPLGLPSEVEAALNNEMLQQVVDASAGEWPPEYSKKLAILALRCCRYDRKERPDLAKEAWGVLQAMVNCPDNKCETPSFFICPMTQEIMKDPHIAADGFTYEEERLTRGKGSLEKEHLQIYNELQKANEQIMELERRLMDANSLMQELQTVQGELQREKDNAVKEAGKMSQINCNNVSCSTGAVALTEFTYTEIKEATNDFNKSKMIGHGGCGKCARLLVKLNLELKDIRINQSNQILMEMGDDPLGLFLLPKAVKDSSLRPPAHGRDVGKESPRWALLDKTAYFAGADVRNATTAFGKTRDGHEIQVTLCTAAQPPLVSYMCVHTPTLKPSDDFANEPEIIAAHDDLLLIRLTLGHVDNHQNKLLSDYFVYQAQASASDGPSLARVTNPGRDHIFPDTHVGILKQQHYIIAALTPTSKPGGEFHLHLYHSNTKQWTTKVLQLGGLPPAPPLNFFHHYTNKVISLSHQAPGLMGFADLWRGVVLVNVLQEEPAPSYILLPPPLRKRNKLDGGNPLDVRDIAIDLQGCINYVEFELGILPHPQRHSGSYIADGWTAAKWSWIAESGCWRMDCHLHSSDISDTMMPRLPNYSEPIPQPNLEKLHVGHPVLSLHDTHLVYLMAKIDHLAHKAWILLIDLRNGVIQQPIDFMGADRTVGICETYVQTTISRYPCRKWRHRRRTGNNNNAIVHAVLDS
uniref:RING-type E3 ubiquitin transferase n=1 Tax=Oryza punctata TaxID=4537 RepID=A0A0E0M4R4_ORYPU